MKQVTWLCDVCGNEEKTDSCDSLPASGGLWRKIKVVADKYSFFDGVVCGSCYHELQFPGILRRLWDKVTRNDGKYYGY
jgi:hypothetical protein